MTLSGPGIPNRNELIRQHREVMSNLYPKKDLDEIIFATILCCGIGGFIVTSAFTGMSMAL